STHAHRIVCVAERLAILVDQDPFRILAKGQHMGQYVVRHKGLAAVTASFVVVVGAWALAARGDTDGRLSDFLRFSAPAGDRPATTDTVVDGVRAAILPSGRLVTPAGTEVNVQAPKPFGLALSPDGTMLATLNSGAGPFSLTLISQMTSGAPVT